MWIYRNRFGPDLAADKDLNVDESRIEDHVVNRIIRSVAATSRRPDRRPSRSYRFGRALGICHSVHVASGAVDVDAGETEVLGARLKADGGASV